MDCNTFCTDIHGPLKMDPADFGNLLVPPAGHFVNLSNTLVYDEIPAKLMTSPASAVIVASAY